MFNTLYDNNILLLLLVVFLLPQGGREADRLWKSPDLNPKT